MVREEMQVVLILPIEGGKGTIIFAAGKTLQHIDDTFANIDSDIPHPGCSLHVNSYPILIKQIYSTNGYAMMCVECIPETATSKTVPRNHHLHPNCQHHRGPPKFILGVFTINSPNRRILEHSLTFTLCDRCSAIHPLSFISLAQPTCNGG